MSARCKTRVESWQLIFLRPRILMDFLRRRRYMIGSRPCSVTHFHMSASFFDFVTGPLLRVVGHDRVKSGPLLYSD